MKSQGKLETFTSQVTLSVAALVTFTIAVSGLVGAWEAEHGNWIELSGYILAGPLYPLWLSIQHGISVSGAAFLALALGAPLLLLYGGFRTDRALLLAASAVLWVAEGYLFGMAIWI